MKKQVEKEAAIRQQKKTITGTVVDKNGETIIGANIVEKGTTNGTVTDVDGFFSLQVEESATLHVSYIGYLSQEITTTERVMFNIILEEDTQALEEVVITGYMTQRKKTLTGSISTVSNQDLTVTKNENVVNMLSGKMPGLRITQRSSQPGAYNTVIDVRGYGEPLFVVDGIPRDKEYFSRMDPEEIESISLLKDGAAAVYGMRAANGVMLITTKSGTSQEGKVDISYSGYYSWQQMLYIPDGISSIEWMTLRNEQNWKDFNGNYLTRRDPLYTDANFADREEKKDYNWLEAIYRNFTPQKQHNLTVSGGGEQVRFFASMGYSKQDGSFKSGSLWSDRWNFRSNVDAKITQRLSARISLGAILSNNHEPNTHIPYLFKWTWLARPDGPYYANDNPDFLNGEGEYLNEGRNLLAESNSDYVGYRLNKTRRLNGTFSLAYEIPGVKGLSARASYDYSMSLPDNTTFVRQYNLYRYDPANDFYAPIVRNSPSSVTRLASFNFDTNMQLGLNYSNKFGMHSVNGALVFEEYYQEWENFSASRNLSVNSEYLFAGDADGQQGTGGTPGDRLNQAFIGQFNYDYAGKYLADFRFRYEGSSRWPKESRWGFFPSVSIGWRISEESLIKNNIDIISNLKLRASYGELGDDNQGDMRFNYPPVNVGYDYAASTRGWYFDNVLYAGVTPTSIPNPRLTWYKVTMKNIALDLGLFNDKLSGTFELFQRDRTGLLATSSTVIPGTVGANLPQENLNADRNFGWEIELAHHNRIFGVNYYVTGQFSATRSMRVDWLETPASHSYDHWRNRTSGRYNSIWWGTESGGMFTSMEDIRNYQTYPMGQGTLPGDWWSVDWNEDGIIDANDNHPLATLGLPIFNYGLSMGASYKNFDLSVNFQGAHRFYLELSELFNSPLPFGGMNTLYWFMDRWHPTDPNADYFHPDTEWISGYYPVTGGNGRSTGTNNMRDATYLRLKTLELGYSLPKGLLSKQKVQSLRVYLSGYNMLTFSKLRDLDPERPSSTPGIGAATTQYGDMYAYPNNKTFTIGVNIKF
jgi:TonB-linked SusC/RagA family outer membrane protein